MALLTAHYVLFNFISRKDVSKMHQTQIFICKLPMKNFMLGCRERGHTYTYDAVMLINA